MPSPDPDERPIDLAAQLAAALEAVEVERRRLAAVLEALPVGVAIADATGRVTHFNTALTRIWGRPPVPQSADEYREWRARWVPGGEPLAADDWAMARTLRTGEVVQGDVVEIEKFDGGGRVVIVNAAAPIKDGEGRVVGGVVAEMDITAQARTEDALRESEARYRAVVENTSAIILRLDPQGVVRYANQRALEFFGYAADELVGRPALGTIIPEQDSGGADLSRLTRDIASDPDRFRSNSNENMRKGGERVWVEWTNSGIYDDEGRLMEFLSVGIDATERKRAEEEALGQRALFETVVTHLPAAVCIVRASDLRVLLVNAVYQAIARDKEMEGKSILEVWPELPELEGIFRSVAQTGQPYSVDDAPYRIRRSRDGPLEEAFFTWSLYPMPLPNGERLLLNAAWETTARRRTDQALAAANARLIEADRRKDEFLAMLGHELRNPLAVIAGAIHLMGSSKLGEEAFGKARAAAERQSAHMTRLVDELLDVSRITEGKVTLRREQLELAGVIETAVESARPLVEARGHRLFQSVAREPLPVKGDPVRLAQAIGNLLNNAAKYTPVCGEIRLIAERRDDHVLLAVCDNGIGIAPDLLPRVFDLFVQGERGPDRSQGGLGIGLTLAKRLVEMHGGRLEAASDGSGQGSQFTMVLPLAPAHAGAAASTRARATAVPARRRLLVVDDNEDGAEMLTLQLQLEGYDARAVYDGSTALKLAASYQPDIVILDIGMPGMDGYEVARRLREDPAHRGTVLVALTGYGQDEHVEATRRAGFDYHLVKPVDIEALRRAIDAPPPVRPDEQGEVPGAVE